MLVAFSLGLLGSLGHCVGMCSAIVVLVNRQDSIKNSRLAWAAVHGGRLMTYAVFGLIAGLFGFAVGQAVPAFQQLQGTLSILTASIAIYLGLAILGLVPSPERAFTGLTQRWSALMRRVSGERSGGLFSALGLGLVWGMLPCGLVITALFTSAVSASPLEGTARMLVFGAGTIPALLGVRWVASRSISLPWPRYAAALLMVIFGLQLALRGAAHWGLINHFMVQGLMLW